MSVPAGQRAKSKFEVLIKARELAKYTLDITKNEKVFKVEYQNSLTNDLIKIAKDIFINCWIANNKRVTDSSIADERIRLQQIAIDNCVALLALIDLAKCVYHLKSKRVWFWAANTIAVRDLIKEWRMSDIKRYKSIA